VGLALDLFSVTGAATEAVPFVSVSMAGPPCGKGRPRFRWVPPGASGRPGFVHTYTPAQTVSIETALKWKGKAAMRGRPLLEGPLAVRLFAMMPVPQSWPNKRRDAALTGLIFHTSTPDGDNIFKLVADGLNGAVYVDDKQIVRHAVFKEYAENPGLIVEVYKLD
jgi:Holliday junction resolvase RusA-like endonuclease